MIEGDNMFRPLRRTTKAMTEEQAKALLKIERRGVFAVNGDDGYPYAIPVNYVYDEESERILFHGARVGHKMDSIKKDDKVCFTVYGNERIDEEMSWAPYMQSTVVFGRCSIIENADEALDCIWKIAQKYYPDKEEIEKEIAKDGKAVAIYAISIEHLCGKQIQEK